jgi:Spy/CpxP family protein refolding chaperone
MKTTWIIAAVLAMGVSFHHIGGAHAQVHGGAGHQKSMAHIDLGKVIKIVDATPQQATKLKALHEQIMKRAGALKARKDLNEVQLKKQFEVLHTDAAIQLKKILNAEQMKKLHAHGAAAMMKGGKAHTPMDVLPHLGLSDDQMARVKQIIANTEHAIVAVKNDGSLTNEQKEIQARHLHEQALTEIHKVLTPEQSKKAHEIWFKHHEGQGGHKNPPPAGG